MLAFCLVGLAGVRAPAAQATVTNVVPMNGSQEPIIGDTIYDNEVLWAYVTSPNGGVVCVHRASDNPGGCNDETDAYAETPVLPFFAGIIPDSGRAPEVGRVHAGGGGGRGRAGHRGQHSLHRPALSRLPAGHDREEQ